MKNHESTQQESIKIFEAIPADKLYTIHNDLRKYHDKWNQDQVIELADTSGIENFYTTTQYLTRTVPIVGAGLVAKGYTEAGVVTAGVSLYADYLISSGKEKLFKSEEKKKKLTELSKDIENLYDRHRELVEILKPLRDSNSLLELSKLLKSLQTEVNKISKEEVKVDKNQNGWKHYLGYIFWSFREDESSGIKELNLLNNGLKDLDSWKEKVTLTDKVKSEFSRLFLSFREGNQLWIEWKKEWEKKRSEHEKIKYLIATLQTAISEYKQGISKEEIEKGIKISLLKLETTQLLQEIALLITTSSASAELNHAFANFQVKIKELSDKNSLTLNIPQTDEEWLDKEVVKQLTKDLQANWNAELTEEIVNLRAELDKYVEEVEKSKLTNVNTLENPIGERKDKQEHHEIDLAEYFFEKDKDQVDVTEKLLEAQVEVPSKGNN